MSRLSSRPASRLLGVLLPCLAIAIPAPADAQRRGAGSGAADSIQYRYPDDPRLQRLKAEASKEIDAMAKQIQVMVDQLFSYGELGFQEFET